MEAAQHRDKTQLDTTEVSSDAVEMYIIKTWVKFLVCINSIMNKIKWELIRKQGELSLKYEKTN